MSAPKATRQYVVLESRIINAGSGEVAWLEVGVYLAHDDDAAVRYHIDKSGADSGTYRAVVRSAWEPLLRVKVVKTTKLTLEHGEKRKREPKQAPESVDLPIAPGLPDLDRKVDVATADPLLAGLAAALEGAPA